MNDPPDLNPVLLALLVEWDERKAAARPATPEEICRHHPELIEDFRRHIALVDWIDPLLKPAEDEPDQKLPRIPGFELLEEIGRGGMGVVYRARDLALDHIVAIKTLTRSAGEDVSRIRFDREAKTLARLRHPGIVPVLAAGIGEDGPYFVMEHVPGGTLKTLKDRFLGKPEAVAALLEQVARAVDYPHQKGIIHRDLKPSNILIDGAGRPLVGDFGVATLLAGETLFEVAGETTADTPPADVTRLTGTGLHVGTPEYAAPEAQPSRASDVWSLGVILHEMLTGELPAESNPRPRGDRPAAERNGSGKTLARSGRSLGRIISTCLALRPEDRYASAGRLADELARWRRRKTRAGMIRRIGFPAAAAVLAFAGGVYAVLPPGQETRSRNIRNELLRAGEVTLISETGRPASHRVWARGGGEVRTFLNPDGTFAVDSGPGQPALIELLDDPGKNRYRFSAEVRQDEGDFEAEVGLYFSAQAVQTDAGPIYLFGRLKYPDLDFGPGLTLVALEYCRLIPPGTTGDCWSVKHGAGKPFQVQQPGALPGRQWRSVSVEVSDAGARGFFDGLPGDRVVGDLSFARSQQWATNQPAVVPPTTRFQVNVIPRGGMGLFVNGCRASFRNARVEVDSSFN